jgi:hypothetical protein
MIPHTLDVLGDCSGESWIIVGKGPSFDAETVRKYQEDGFKVCSINNAAAALDVRVNLIVANDWAPLNWFGPLDTVVAAPSTLHANIPNSIPHMFQACAAYAKWAKTLTLFDMKLTNEGAPRRYYPDYPLVETCTSSTESAVQLLAFAGVRRIHFIGVDGGQPHHNAFEERSDKVPLDGQFKHIRRLFFKWTDLHFSGLPEATRLNKD